MPYLLQGNSYQDQGLYYASSFLGEPLTYLSSDGGTLLVSGMERERAEDESTADRVATLGDLGYDNLLEEKGRLGAYAACVAKLLDEASLESVRIPPGLPTYIYRRLSRDHELEVDPDLLVDERRGKSRDEVASVRKAVKGAEAAIRAARETIEAAERNGDTLYIDGETLTAEHLRHEIEHVLVDHDCVAEDLIVAPGTESHKPHWRGSGAVQLGEPVVIDVFPRHRAERYCGDMTRTVLPGENRRIEDMHAAVVEALQAAERVAAPGVKCTEVHEAAASTLEELGHETGGDEGFVHSTGHGVGLDVHEPPRLSSGSDETLQEGDVFTIEPGLYYGDVGGVRVEDTFVARGDGCEPLPGLDRSL